MLILRIKNVLFDRPLIKMRLKKVGCHFRLGYGSTVLKPYYVSIGDYFFTGPGFYMSTNRFNPIEIGNSIIIGPQVMILGGNHNINYTQAHMFYCKTEEHCKKPIKIEDGCWIGAKNMILSGAQIGEGAVIGACSLVNDYVPPYSVAVGVPARKMIKRFDNAEDLKELLRNSNSGYSFEQINEIYSRYNLAY